MIKGILIGNPVDRSISHVTHNEIFRQSGILGVYEKRAIALERLAEEVEELKKGGYAFLAVTMPLKEAILPFIDFYEGEIGAINTIEVREGRWIGHNFDGIGCLNAIENIVAVAGKRVLVLGAGGAARAAIYEAKRRGAEVFVYNRTYERALRVCQQFGVQAVKSLVIAVDVVIQATCADVVLDVWPPVVMEMICNPKQTLFVKRALAEGCQVVFGHDMFAELSFAQLHLICGAVIHKDLVIKIVKNFFVEN